MNFSFKKIKEKLVESLSNKYSKKQIGDATDVINKELLNSAKEKEIEKANDLYEFMKTDDYEKIKNLSYWIFNNYGIPENNDCVFTFYLGRGYDISEVNKVKIEYSKNLKSGIFKKAFTKIISEYITEYTDGKMSQISTEPESIFVKIEKEIYPDYKYTEDYWRSKEFNEVNGSFINFKTDTDSSLNDEQLKIINGVNHKINSYKETYGNQNKPKLILPVNGLTFDSINNKKIEKEAKNLNLSKDELLIKVKSCLESVKSNDFITIEAVYQSNFLLSFVLFRRVNYILDPDNQIITIDHTNPHLNIPNYYGSGANEILTEAQNKFKKE